MAWWFEKSKYEQEENGRYPIVRGLGPHRQCDKCDRPPGLSPWWLRPLKGHEK